MRCKPFVVAVQQQCRIAPQSRFQWTSRAKGFRLAVQPCAVKRAVSTGADVSTPKQVASDESFDWVLRYADVLRALPIYGGVAGFVALLLNRVLSGIAPVVDASSSQSRADVLGIVLSAILLLTGLSWLSLKPKQLSSVEPNGERALACDDRLPSAAKRELYWAWSSLQSCMRCCTLVVIYQKQVVFAAGAVARGGAALRSVELGDICSRALQSGQGNYLANLVLYPGRAEFSGMLPSNMSGAVIQPVGEQGLLIVGTDTVRGFSRVDQAWIADIADKLDATFGDAVLARTGFKSK